MYVIKPDNKNRLDDIYLGNIKGYTFLSCYSHNTLSLSNIRLIVPKPYCGNHPGPCLVKQKKRRLNFLEWNDWLDFNNQINDVLDAENIAAKVASLGTFIHRKGLQRRTHYSWFLKGKFPFSHCEGYFPFESTCLIPNECQEASEPEPLLYRKV